RAPVMTFYWKLSGAVGQRCVNGSCRHHPARTKTVRSVSDMRQVDKHEDSPREISLTEPSLRPPCRAGLSLLPAECLPTAARVSAESLHQELAERVHRREEGLSTSSRTFLNPEIEIEQRCTYSFADECTLENLPNAMSKRSSKQMMKKFDHRWKDH